MSKPDKDSMKMISQIETQGSWAGNKAFVASLLTVGVILFFRAPCQGGEASPALAVNSSAHATMSLRESNSVARERIESDQIDPDQPEIFPKLVIKGEVYRDVSVVRANPVEVTLHWESGGGGVFKRQELPPILAARYPFDPKAAEEWAKDTVRQEHRIAEKRGRDDELASATSGKVRAQQREHLLQGLKLKEEALHTQIALTEKQLSNLNEIIPVLDGRANGTRRNSFVHLAADRAREQKLRLLGQLHEMQAQLDALHEQMNECR
jgi:hypothetical protein